MILQCHSMTLKTSLQGFRGVLPWPSQSCITESTCNLYLYRDEDMDGEWEAPQIANPKCESAPGCGVWQRPMIDNPNYKGKWKPPMIDNPNYQVCAF